MLVGMRIRARRSPWRIGLCRKRAT